MGRDKLRFAYVGNISDIEGLELLIESFAIVYNGNEDRLDKLKFMEMDHRKKVRIVL